LSLAQTREHKDSTYWEGRLYPDSVYKVLKTDYDNNNYESYLMPGVAYLYYTPKESDSVGNFQGIAVEYLIYAQVHKNDDPGPSHTRIYLKLNILNSDKDEMGDMFMYTAGVDLSFERNPSRNYLVPYFGLEIGGISQKQLGTSLQFSPTFGLHVLSKRNLFINVQGAYIYPKENFEILKGWIAQVGINFAMW
jgi:hypothetical protein